MRRQRVKWASRFSTRPSSTRKKTTAQKSDRLPVGRIAGIFGIHGELKCDPSSAGRMLFVPGARLDATLGDGRNLEIALDGVREHKGRLLVTLSGVTSANDAEQFAGATLYADADRIVLDPGEYLDRDLAGCELFDESGAPLGKVQRVEHYPSSDMLIVGGRMVPMVSAFIKSVDTKSKRIVVDVPPGLLSDED